jgi:hypothetical protein
VKCEKMVVDIKAATSATHRHRPDKKRPCIWGPAILQADAASLDSSMHRRSGVGLQAAEGSQHLDRAGPCGGVGLRDGACVAQDATVDLLAGC